MLLKEKTKVENKEKAALRREVAQKQREMNERANEKVRIESAQKASRLPKQVTNNVSKNLKSKIYKGGGGAARRRQQVVHKSSSALQGVEARNGCFTRPTKKPRESKVKRYSTL